MGRNDIDVSVNSGAGEVSAIAATAHARAGATLNADDDIVQLRYLEDTPGEAGQLKRQPIGSCLRAVHAGLCLDTDVHRSSVADRSSLANQRT